MNDASMTDATNWRSGKGHRDENFPVASCLIHPRHRGPILAFYNFVRTADDIADHATLAPDEKLDLLDRLDARPHSAPTARMWRRCGCARRWPSAALSPRHAQDLLAAFKLDVTKLRYRDWDDLIGYCSLSAMPVGRFVLDVHGESRGTWPANDALCAALQIINHLQDCQADYRNLDRVYIPLDLLAARGIGVEALGEPQASPPLLAALHSLAERTGRLLSESDVFPALINDRRLALEVSVINTLAHRITRLLTERDPLRDRVHLSNACRRRLTVGRRSQRRVPTPRRAAAAHDANATRCVSEQAHPRRGRARLSQLVLYGACASCRAPQREAMFEIYSFCRAVDDIADDPGPRDARRAQLAQWRARYRRGLSRRRAGGACRPGAGGARHSIFKREDFIAIIDGMEMDVVADIRAPDRADARSLLRSRRLRGRPAFGARVRNDARRRPLRSRIISAARCSSPTFCATSTKTPALGRLYLPREALQAAGIASTDPRESCWRIRRSRKPATPSSIWPRAQFRAAQGDHGEKPAPGGARAAHHGRGLSHHSGDA